MPVDLGPDGLTFQDEVTIALPCSDAELHDAGASDETAIQVWSYDKATATWQQAAVVAIDTENNIITTRLQHFSIVARIISNVAPPADVGRPQPGDLLYATGSMIRGIDPAAGWYPGHVGIYTGEKAYPGTGLATGAVMVFQRYNVVEAVREGVQYAYYDLPNVVETDEASLAGFQDSGTYMGARESLQGPLSPEQSQSIVAFVEAQIGKPYAKLPLVGSAFGHASGALVKGPDKYTCVGLAEKAYEVAGINYCGTWWE